MPWRQDSELGAVLVVSVKKSVAVGVVYSGTWPCGSTCTLGQRGDRSSRPTPLSGCGPSRLGCSPGVGYPRIASTDGDDFTCNTRLVMGALGPVTQRMISVAWKSRVGKESGLGPARS
jgi:hypothetical protein